MTATQRALPLLYLFAFASHVHAGILSDLLDFSTPILSTGDVLSDGYMCYHFRETAEEEGEEPIFFMISASLLTLSSICGVILFLYNNWGDASKASLYKKVQGDETEDHEGSDKEQQLAIKSNSPWLDRWSLGEKVSNIARKCAGDERPMLQSVFSAFLVLLLVLVLVPVGQILPILLWLQARHSAAVMPEEPRFPLETMPREPQSRDLRSPEWQLYKRAYKEWVIADLCPYTVRSNHYFEAQLKHKINTQFPFVMETAVESTPQSLLQISALVIYSQRDAAKITVLQCFSMILSLVSIFSKAYIVCESLVKEIFIFKMLCALSDVAGLFFAIASLWALRRGDDGAIGVFFLSRPVDLFAAIYVWSIFAFACIFTAALLLATTEVWLDGISMSMVQGLAPHRWRYRETFGMNVIIRLRERWPKQGDWETKEFKEDLSPDIEPGVRTTPPCLFVFASLLVFQICILCVLCLLMLPALLGLQVGRTFWIALCIQKQEAALSHADIAGSYPVKKTIIPSLCREGYFQSSSEPQVMSCEAQASLFGAGTGFDLAVRSRQKPFPLVSERYETQNSFQALPIVADAGNDDILMVDIHIRYVYPEGRYKKAQQQTRDSYVQAYSFVREGSDFEARLRAVLHALWTSHYDFVPDPLDPLHRCRDFATTVLAVLKTVPAFFQDLEISLPYRAYIDVGGIPLREERWETFCPFRFAKCWEWTEFQDMREDWRNSESAYPCISACIHAMEPIMNCLLTISVTWFALYAIFFPLLSFGLSTHYALIGNQCKAVQSARDAYEAEEWSRFNKNAIWDVIFDLHDEYCYEASGTPLNWVRTVLFLVQAVLFAALLSTTPFLCWPFLRFALQVPKYIVHESPETFLQRVYTLYEKNYEKKTRS